MTAENQHLLCFLCTVSLACPFLWPLTDIREHGKREGHSAREYKRSSAHLLEPQIWNAFHLRHTDIQLYKLRKTTMAENRWDGLHIKTAIFLPIGNHWKREELEENLAGIWASSGILCKSTTQSQAWDPIYASQGLWFPLPRQIFAPSYTKYIKVQYKI